MSAERNGTVVLTNYSFSARALDLLHQDPEVQSEGPLFSRNLRTSPYSVVAKKAYGEAMAGSGRVAEELGPGIAQERRAELALYMSTLPFVSRVVLLNESHGSRHRVGEVVERTQEIVTAMFEEDESLSLWLAKAIPDEAPYKPDFDRMGAEVLSPESPIMRIVDLANVPN